MAELFENIEVNRESRWRILWGLIGGSFVLHLVLLWSALYVPAFRDALSIAHLIANTRFVDKPYVATKIGDDVDFVQLSNEKFRYPEGYFATPEQLAAAAAAQSVSGLLAGVHPPDPFAPKIISQAQPAGAIQPENKPSPSPLPSASPVAAASPSPVAEGQSVANANKNASLTPEESQTQLERTAKENNIELPDENQINKKALKDFATYVNDLKDQGKLDLDKPFEVVIEAEMDENGKLKNPHITKKSGDPNLVDLFGKMVAALNDSGFLIYWKPINKDNPGAKMIFTIKQGENEVLASVESETSSPDSARILAKALNAALVFGAGSRAGKDEEVIMRNTNASPDGKKVVVNFSMPRQTVVDLIKKQLEPGL